MSRAAQRLAKSGEGAAASKSKTSLPRGSPILRDLGNPICLGGMGSSGMRNTWVPQVPEAPPPTIIVHIRSQPEATYEASFNLPPRNLRIKVRVDVAVFFFSHFKYVIQCY